MTRGVSWFFVAPLVLLGLSGCQFSLFDQREAWRSEAEERCLAEGLVKSSAYTTRVRGIDGAGTCGMDTPFKVSGLADGSIAVTPTATMACPATAAVDRWMVEGVQPAAMAWFGQPVAAIKQMSSYSCRNMNGARSGKISEHAFGNALDIGTFVLADGREVTVKNGWKGQPDEQGFLRTVQATACERFTTVLAPGSNIYHYDHIHVDLMRRSSGRGVCQPAPRMPTPPNAPPPMAGQGFPQQGYPPGNYPPTPAGGPMVISPEPAPSDAHHGVDPNYQPPQPAVYPLPPANNPYPAQEPYRQDPYAQPPRPPRPNGPLPPAGVPMVKWKGGADPIVTGSTGSTARGYAPEPKPASRPFSFRAPIEPPAAIPGED